MSHTIDAIIVSVTSVTTTSVVAIATEDPIVYTVFGVVVVGLMIPIVRWMMGRQDTLQADYVKILKEQVEASTKNVVALGSIIQELKSLNQHHKEIDRNREAAVKQILERIDGLPDKIKKNGAA